MSTEEKNISMMDIQYLRTCIKNGDLETATRLIEEMDIDVNEKVSSEASLSNGKTLLHIASAYGHVDICKMLLDRGADINALDNSFSTPLHDAAIMGKKDMCLFLLSRNADSTIKNDYGCIPYDYSFGFQHIFL